jgi:hypothetical protein
MDKMDKWAISRGRAPFLEDVYQRLPLCRAHGRGAGKRLPDRDPLSRGPPARPGAPDPELQAKMALLQQTFETFETLDRRDTAVKNTLEKMVCRLPCPRMRIPLREGLVNIIKYYYSGSWRDCGGASANGPLGATSCHGGT